MKLTREEFRNRADKYGEGGIKEITITFDNGERVTLTGSNELVIGEGLMVFSEHSEGVIAVGAASPRMLNHVRDTQIPSILQSMGAETEESTEEGDMGSFMEMLRAMGETEEH